MKLVENFIEKFHTLSLPSPEKCLIIEEGDELYIKKWIKNGKINGKAKDMFNWIEKKYLNNKSQLKETHPYKFKEIIIDMKLIENFIEKFHTLSLPSPEKCLIIEEGDELYIKKWIKNGKINGKAKDMFNWIEKKYFNNKSELKERDLYKFRELNDRFLIKYWRIIILLCDYQMKYRYYSKAINAVKDKSYPDMNSNDFFQLFDKK